MRRTIPTLLCVLVLAATSNGFAAAADWTGPAGVGIEVRDEGGQPIAGAAVVLAPGAEAGAPAAGDGDAPPFVFTDAGGRVEVRNLAEGEWQVEVRAAGYMIFNGYLRLTSAAAPEVGFSSRQRTGTFWQPLEVRFFVPGSPGDAVMVAVTKEERRGEKKRVAEQSQLERQEKKAEERAEVRERRKEKSLGDGEVAKLKEPPKPPVAPAEPPPPQVADAAPPPPVAPPPSAPPPPAPPRTVAQPPPATERGRPAPPPPPPPRPAAPPSIPPSAPPPAAAPPSPPPAAAPPSPPPAVAPPSPPPAAAPPSPPPAAAPPSPPPAVAPPSPPPAAAPPSPPPAAAPPSAPAPSRPPGFETPPPAAPRVADAGARPSPNVAPAPAAPAPDAPRSVPSIQTRPVLFTGGACPECKPGEWALVIEHRAAAASAGAADSCGEGRDAAVKRLAQEVLVPAGATVAAFAGAVADGYGNGLPAATRETMPADLAEALAPRGGPCQSFAGLLPQGARFIGFRFEAEDGSGKGDCFGEEPCAIGQARWTNNPRIERTTTVTVIHSSFINESTSAERRARMTLYFQPPRGWRPPG